MGSAGRRLVNIQSPAIISEGRHLLVMATVCIIAAPRTVRLLPYLVDLSAGSARLAAQIISTFPG